MMDMFSNIKIQRELTDDQGNIADYKYIRVPVTYASKEQFIARLYSRDTDDQAARIQTVLPRISLNMIDIVYDANRKTSVTNRRSKQVTYNNNQALAQQYNAVPYDMIFEMGIYTRYQDDIFQIVEQILPYFQPNFETKIIELDENEVQIDNRKITVVIESVAPSEDSENQSGTLRHIEWTIQFRMKGWLYPPVNVNSGIIRTIYLNFGQENSEITEQKVIKSDRVDVSSSLDIKYSRRTRSEPVSIQLKYNTRTSVDLLSSLSWKSYQYVSNDLEVNYNSSSYVVTPLYINYNTRNYTNEQLDIDFSTRNYTNNQIDIQYNTRTQVSNSLGIDYAITGFVSNDVSVEYSTRESTNNILYVDWGITPYISNIMSIGYQIN